MELYITHHRALVRYEESGRFYCWFDFAITTPVEPSKLDEYAVAIALALADALNGDRESSDCPTGRHRRVHQAADER